MYVLWIYVSLIPYICTCPPYPCKLFLWAWHHQHCKGFTKCKVLDAIAAPKAQAMTGHPSDAQFNKMVRNKTIKNCLIKPEHIANVHAIFGSSIAGVHRKTIRHKPEQVEAEPGCIADNFHQLHPFVVLTADVIFVNGIAFLSKLSQKLRLALNKRLPHARLNNWIAH